MENKNINLDIGISDFDLNELRRPIPLKWRVQRAFPNKINPTHVIMVGYIDSRDVQSRLDDVVGMANWQSRYFECKGKQFCEIGIYTNAGWVFKGDSGSPSQTEKDKGETSDAFKRAAVHWGINRAGYRVGEVKLPCKMYLDKPYPCDDTGSFLKGQALFDFCNKAGKIDEMEIEFDNSFDQMSDAKEIILAKRAGIKPGKSPEMP